ncbi:MAG: thioredoxin family protein [Calditrichaceae bacterium]|nr:thioredoxin family protein [Calditrichia bacterium]NUQ40061.1 thioredoxin family protein [Calditrichaceae bacterium]
MKRILMISIALTSLFLLLACGADSRPGEAQPSVAVQKAENPAKITFVELGSVNCIPCRKMQPIMASIEKKYDGQVKVIFYDVWKPDQRHYAQQFGIRLIPTQVFLDEYGNEIMRHEGFFPEEEIDAFLQAQGLTVKTSS